MGYHVSFDQNFIDVFKNLTYLTALADVSPHTILMAFLVTFIFPPRGIASQTTAAVRTELGFEPKLLNEWRYRLVLNSPNELRHEINARILLWVERSQDSVHMQY